MALTVTGLSSEYATKVIALSGGPYESVLRDARIDVRVYSRTWRFDPVPVLRMWADVLMWRPDLIHSWGSYSTLLVGPLARLLSIPLVDGTVRSARGPMAPWLFRAGSFFADEIIANSMAGLRAWRVPQDKARLVRNGFDARRLVAVDPANGAREQRVVAMVGRFAPAKDYRCLLAAARLLQRRRRGEFLFLLVGNGPDREAIEREASDLAASSTVRFFDAGTEPSGIVARADIAVLLTSPGHYEGCPNALLEAMAHGLPVVCTDSGGNPELVRHHVHGLLAEPGSSDSVAAALERLADDPALCHEMGNAGRDRVLAQYSLARMLSRTRLLYQHAGCHLPS